MLLGVASPLIIRSPPFCGASIILLSMKMSVAFPQLSRFSAFQSTPCTCRCMSSTTPLLSTDYRRVMVQQQLCAPPYVTTILSNATEHRHFNVAARSTVIASPRLRFNNRSPCRQFFFFFSSSSRTAPTQRPSPSLSIATVSLSPINFKALPSTPPS